MNTNDLTKVKKDTESDLLFERTDNSLFSDSDRGTIQQDGLLTNSTLSGTKLTKKK